MPKRILIVEDDPLVQRMLIDTLAAEGFEPVAADNAVQALTIVEAQAPDCIIADVVLPNIDGFRFRQIMREAPHTRDIPFIFVTQLSSSEDQIRGLALGVDDYIIKPFKPEVFVWKVRNLLAKSDRAREASSVDSLTLCYNRRCFDQKLDEEIARATRYGECFTLVMLDLDHFKNVNDTWGHVVGDRLLAYFAEFVRRRKRACDLLFRYGGDEFFLMLPRVALDGGVACAGRVRTALESEAKDPNTLVYKIPMTVSGGVATFPNHGVDRISILKSCDDVLYRAKELGRNRVEYVSTSSSINAPEGE